MDVRKTLAAAALVALAGLATGCGNSASSGSGSAADAPSNASKTDFCTAIKGASSSNSPRKLAEQLTKVGTPSGIDSSSRHGFEVLVKAFEKLPDNPQTSDIQKLIQGVSPSDQTDIEAFFAYAQTECGLSGPSVPTSPST
jgi:hypothetical protein